MAKISITIDPDAFEEGNFLYVWFRSNPNRAPFYVGETSKSLADRVGLHIRKSNKVTRSGAAVGTLMHNGNWPAQEYTVLSFLVSEQILCGVSEENGGICNTAGKNRARKAIEYAVHQGLLRTYKSMHKPKGSKWKASSASTFCENIIEQCSNHINNNA